MTDMRLTSESKGSLAISLDEAEPVPAEARGEDLDSDLGGVTSQLLHHLLIRQRHERAWREACWTGCQRCASRQTLWLPCPPMGGQIAARTAGQDWSWACPRRGSGRY